MTARGDPKLVADVHKILREHNSSESQNITTEFLLQKVLKNPKYGRKNQNVLRGYLSKILSSFRAQNENMSMDIDKSTVSNNDKKSDDVVANQEVEKISASLNSMLYKKGDAENCTSTSDKDIKKKKKKKKSKKRHENRTSNVDQEINKAILDGLSGSPNQESFVCPTPLTRYSDLAGIETALQSVRELIEYPLSHPEIYSHLGVKPPRGILLHGAPGCGKTLLAHAIAGEIGETVTFFKLAATEIVSGVSGEAEAKLRNLFQDAKNMAPSLIFIDEIDAIIGKRETSQRGMERRIIAQLLTCIDDLANSDQSIIVIGATNHPNSLDSALRRAGRFDREICLGVPDIDARKKIIKSITQKMKLHGEVDFGVLARMTPGFVGADLTAVAKEAAVNAINRVFKLQLQSEFTNLICEDKTKMHTNSAVSDHLRSCSTLNEAELSKLFITMEDFKDAIPKVQPSAKREGFATIPGITWDDVGALTKVREELIMSILYPIRIPHRYSRLGLDMPSGVLLYGPPGCGKTLLAKAISNESGANFIAIKGPELLDKFVGESEKAVRTVFQRAQSSAPCIIFFDEMDALAPKRGSSSSGGSGVSERVVNQLLTELDGLHSRKNVFVIAATNRPDIIDPAMLRPGRLDKLLYVSLPKPSDRFDILKTLARKSPLASDVNLKSIANDIRCTNFSGADLKALVREAALSSLRKSLLGKDIAKLEKEEINESQKVFITGEDFEEALKIVKSSISPLDLRKYNKMQINLRSSLSSTNALISKVEKELAPDNKDHESSTNNSNSNSKRKYGEV